jgi:hypothetical protein
VGAWHRDVPPPRLKRENGNLALSASVRKSSRVPAGSLKTQGRLPPAVDRPQYVIGGQSKPRAASRRRAGSGPSAPCVLAGTTEAAAVLILKGITDPSAAAPCLPGAAALLKELHARPALPEHLSRTSGAREAGGGASMLGSPTAFPPVPPSRRGTRRGGDGETRSGERSSYEPGAATTSRPIGRRRGPPARPRSVAGPERQDLSSRNDPAPCCAEADGPLGRGLSAPCSGRDTLLGVVQSRVATARASAMPRLREDSPRRH